MIYVTSDLHGTKIADFKKLLESVNFSKEDRCIVLGDVIDRGSDGVELLSWIAEQPNIELVLGNHEDMMISCEFVFYKYSVDGFSALEAKEKEAFYNWLGNGARPTLVGLSKLGNREIVRLFEYLGSVQLYKQVNVNGKNFILTHSGVGDFSADKRLSEYSRKELLWNRPKLTDKYYADAITVFGHTPTHFFGEEYRGKAIITDTWIDVDIGAPLGCLPMLLRLDDLKEFYLYKNVYS